MSTNEHKQSAKQKQMKDYSTAATISSMNEVFVLTTTSTSFYPFQVSDTFFSVSVSLLSSFIHFTLCANHKNNFTLHTLCLAATGRNKTNSIAFCVGTSVIFQHFVFCLKNYFKCRRIEKKYKQQQKTKNEKEWEKGKRMERKKNCKQKNFK